MIHVLLCIHMRLTVFYSGFYGDGSEFAFDYFDIRHGGVLMRFFDWHFISLLYTRRAEMISRNDILNLARPSSHLLLVG